MNFRIYCVGIILGISFCFCSWNVGTENTLLCFYNSGASSRSGDARFTMDDVDANLCTHLAYYHVELDIETKKTKVYSQFEKDKIKLIELKQKNPQLKVLVVLSVKPHLWNKTHVEWMNNSNHVDGLIETVLDFLSLYEFNGILLRFYPNEKEKIGFMNLVSAMKQAFQPHSYLLTLVGSRDESLKIEGYDISSLNKDVDLLILRAYDFHVPSIEPNRADHHSPLYDRPITKKRNVDSIVSQWINKGFLPQKILLGIALHGNSWTLSSNITTPPAPAFGRGPPGKHLKINGFISYYEICHAVKFDGWKVFQDSNKTMGPYAVSPAGHNQTWVGYDDPAMAVIKAKFILSKGLGGAAVLDITLDDFLNKCGDGHNPMLSAIYNTLIFKETKKTSSSTSAIIGCNLVCLFLFLILFYFQFFPFF